MYDILSIGIFFKSLKTVMLIQNEKKQHLFKLSWDLNSGHCVCKAYQQNTRLALTNWFGC